MFRRGTWCHYIIWFSKVTWPTRFSCFNFQIYHVLFQNGTDWTWRMSECLAHICSVTSWIKQHHVLDQCRRIHHPLTRWIWVESVHMPTGEQMGCDVRIQKYIVVYLNGSDFEHSPTLYDIAGLERSPTVHDMHIQNCIMLCLNGMGI